MKNVLLFFLMSIQISLFAQLGEVSDKLPDPFQVVPKPKNIKLSSEKGINSGELKTVQLVGNIQKPVLGNILSSLPLKSEGAGSKLILQISNLDDVPESMEGYVLEISDGIAKIVSRGKAGLFLWLSDS